MKKHLSLLLIAIFFMPFIYNTASADTGVDIFFLPDSGYIRVDANLLVDMNGSQLFFQLFPHAQITSIWIPNLQSYTVERTNAHTLVTVILADFIAEPQMLELSYEGFLPELPLTDMGALDQSVQWFPTLSKPVTTDIAKITIPEGFHAAVPGNLAKHQTATFELFTWNLAEDTYPVLTYGPATSWEEDSTDEDSDDYIYLDELLAIMPQEMPVEPMEIGEVPIEQLPVEEGAVADITQDLLPRFNLNLAFTSLEDISDTKIGLPQVILPVLPEDLLIDTITQWDEAITLKDRDALQALLHPDFVNQSQFVDFLFQRPHTYKQVSTEIVTKKPDDYGMLLEARMTWNNQISYRLSSYWSWIEARWQLKSADIRPSVKTIDSGLRLSLEQWLTKFHLAINDELWDVVQQNLAMHPARQQLIVDFFQSTKGNYNWTLHSISDTTLEITGLFMANPNQNYLVIYRVLPEGHTWQLSDITIVAL